MYTVRFVMRTERTVEPITFEEIPYKDSNASLIGDFIPDWEGGSHGGNRAIFHYRNFNLILNFLPDQEDIWLREWTTWQGKRQVLDEPFYHLSQVDRVLLCSDEWKVTFLTKDIRGKVEISNKGRTIVYQNHENRTDKIVTINLP